MGIRDKIQRIASEEVKNYTDFVVTSKTNQNQQNTIGVVQSIDSSGNAVVGYPDGTSASASISTSRPVFVGAYVLTVGGVII